MQEAHAASSTRQTSFSLSAAIFSISTGEAAPSGTALNLCFEAGSILAVVIDQLETKQNIASPADIIRSVRAAASLIGAAQILSEIEEN